MHIMLLLGSLFFGSRLQLLFSIGCFSSFCTRSYDNAAMESFFDKLKSECVNRTQFHHQAQARLAIFEYLECFYVRSVQPKLAFSSEGMAGKDMNLDNS
jgi:hypothetical protein